MKSFFNSRAALFVTALFVCCSLFLSGCMDLYDEEEVQLSFTVTFDGNGGTYTDDDENEITSYTQTFTYGVSQALTSNLFSLEGYDFLGWSQNQSATTAQYANGDSYETSTDVTLYAVWVAQGDIAYTVQHWKQNLTISSEDTFSADDYELSVTETLYGYASKYTSAASKGYDGFSDGFTADSSDRSAITQVVISEDGSTVVNVYYDRLSYTLTYTDGLGDDEQLGDGETITLPNDGAAVSYRYGASVTVTLSGAARTGYTFSKWYRDDTSNADATGKDSTYTGYYTTEATFAMPAFNVALAAVWEAKTDTVYNVCHYKQALEGNDWLQPEIVPCRGTTGETVIITPNTYTGFKASSVSGTIAASGSTIINVYYTRNTHTVTYYDGTTAAEISVPADSTSYRYGATVTLSYTNSNDVAMSTVGLYSGYTFLGWAASADATAAEYTEDGTSTFTMEDADVSLYAVWSANNVSGGTITITPPTYRDVDLGLSATAASDGNSVTFTVASGYANYTWFVDGADTLFTEGSTNTDARTVSYTWDCSSNEADTYSVTLVVTDASGNHYSAYVDVTLSK